MNFYYLVKFWSKLLELTSRQGLSGFCTPKKSI
jgi:hypothetical protein